MANEDTPFDDEVTTATTDEAPEVKQGTAPEATDEAEATSNMQGEDPEDMTNEVASLSDPEPEPEPEAKDTGWFQTQLQEMDKDIGVVTGALAKLKDSRNKFYAEWEPKVNVELPLHELNEIQRRITRTEGARRNRVIEGLDRLADTMNLRPRSKRDPMFPHESAQEK